MRAFRAAAALLVLAWAAHGCAGTYRPGEVPTGRRLQSTNVAASPDDAYRAASHLATEWGWELGFYDDQWRIFQARAPGNPGRPDDDVEITVARSASGSIVTVRSRVATASNVEYLRSFLTELQGRLAAF
jgi:hypothetical protein